jgi:hypothetical protein
MDLQCRKFLFLLIPVGEFTKDVTRVVSKCKLSIIVAGRSKSVIDTDVVHDAEGVRCKGDIAAVLVVFGTGLVDYGGDTVLFEAGDQYRAGKTAIDD